MAVNHIIVMPGLKPLYRSPSGGWVELEKNAARFASLREAERNCPRGCIVRPAAESANPERVKSALDRIKAEARAEAFALPTNSARRRNLCRLADAASAVQANAPLMRRLAEILESSDGR